MAKLIVPGRKLMKAKVEHHRNFADFIINLDFATLNKNPE
jgi:hypothetical protein